MASMSFFAESMKSTGLRKLVAIALYEDLRQRRPRSWSVRVHLVVDQLQIRIELWWPWLLLAGVAHLVAWRWALRRARVAVRTMQVPMREIRVRVGSRKRRPR